MGLFRLTRHEQRHARLLGIAAVVSLLLAACNGADAGSGDSGAGDPAPPGWVAHPVDTLGFAEPIVLHLAYPQGWDVAVDEEDLTETDAVAEFYRVLEDATTYGQISVFADGHIGGELGPVHVLQSRMVEYGLIADWVEVDVDPQEVDVAGADAAQTIVFRVPATNLETGAESVRVLTGVFIEVAPGAVATVIIHLHEDAVADIDAQVLVSSLRVES